jgi:hypothetical protein
MKKPLVPAANDLAAICKLLMARDSTGDISNLGRKSPSTSTYIYKVSHGTCATHFGAIET